MVDNIERELAEVVRQAEIRFHTTVTMANATAALLKLAHSQDVSFNHFAGQFRGALHRPPQPAQPAQDHRQFPPPVYPQPSQSAAQAHVPPPPPGADRVSIQDMLRRASEPVQQHYANGYGPPVDSGYGGE